jgi:signal transduction histidine kinase
LSILARIEDRLTIGGKVGVLLAFSILSSSFILSYSLYSEGLRELEGELRRDGIKAAVDLASKSVTPLVKDDVWELYRALKDTIRQIPGYDGIIYIEYAAVLDSKGRIAVHSSLNRHPLMSAFTTPGTLIERTSDGIEIRSERQSGKPEIYHISSPIAFENELVGTAVVGISEKRLEQTISKLRSHILILAFLLTTATILIGWTISLRFLRPMKRITEKIGGLQSIISGDLKPDAPGTKDEIINFSNFIDLVIDRYEELLSELTLERRKLDNILNGITAAMIVVDKEMNIVWQNRIHRNWFGEGLGRRCRPDGVAPRTSCQACPVIESISQKKTFTCESRRETVSGETRVFSVLAAPTYNKSGEVIGALELSLDVTSQMEMRDRLKRKERLEMAGQMAAGMAHEIRNPLNAIVTALQIISQGSEKTTLSQRTHVFSIVMKETDRLNGLLNGFLDLSHGHKPIMTPCDLNQIVNDTLDLVSFHGQGRSAPQIVRSLGADLPRAAVDPNLIKQVIWNIAINGIHSMPDGGTLYVSTKRENGSAILTIRDSGIGMTEEEIRNCFVPFFTTKANGVGLGMALAKKIIDQHEGNISVSSQPGRGTEFRICIPLNAKGSEFEEVLASLVGVEDIIATAGPAIKS